MAAAVALPFHSGSSIISGISEINVTNIVVALSPQTERFVLHFGE
ncbi:hypothetical protein L533_5504, partial [Bordetella bronchiseptica OSU553]